MWFSIGILSECFCVHHWPLFVTQILILYYTSKWMHNKYKQQQLQREKNYAPEVRHFVLHHWNGWMHGTVQKKSNCREIYTASDWDKTDVCAYEYKCIQFKLICTCKFAHVMTQMNKNLLWKKKSAFAPLQ